MTTRPRLIGTIKIFDADAGYGFLASPEAGRDVFLGAAELRRSGICRLDILNLRVGDTLEFEIGKDDRGRCRAERISLLVGC